MPDHSALVLRAGTVFGALMSQAASRTARSNSSAIRIALAASPAAAGAAARDADGDLGDPPASPPKVLDLKEDKDPRKASVLQSIGEQLSFGGVLGFAAGYSIRKVGKAILFLVGTEVVILQYMAYREWLVMDWRRVGRDLAPKFSRSTWEGLLEVLVYKMPFSAAFSGGLMAGLRLSAPK